MPHHNVTACCTQVSGFYYGQGNKREDRLPDGKQRCPWSLATPEELQVHCRFLGKELYLWYSLVRDETQSKNAVRSFEIWKGPIDLLIPQV